MIAQERFYLAANAKKKQRRNKKITSMVTSMIVVFIFCWLPYHCFKLSQVNDNQMSKYDCDRASHVTLLFAYMNRWEKQFDLFELNKQSNLKSGSAQVFRVQRLQHVATKWVLLIKILIIILQRCCSCYFVRFNMFVNVLWTVFIL